MRLLPLSQSNCQKRSAAPLTPQVSHRGFTLIELVVVIGIIIMILGFATPGIIGIMRGKKVEQGVAAVIDLLERTRMEAMTKNTYIWVGLANILSTETPSGINELWLISFKSKNSEKRLSDATAILLPVSALKRVEGVAVFPKGLLPENITKKIPEAAKDFYTEKASNIPFYWTTAASQKGTQFDRLILFTPRGEALFETGEASMPPPEGYICIGLGRSSQGQVSNIKVVGSSSGDKDMAAVMISGLTGRISTMRP